MKIKFLKEYKFLRGFENDVKLTTTQIFKDAIIDTVEDEVPDEDVQWLIDNGFAEEAKESGWRKPQQGDIYWAINSYDATSYKQTWHNYPIERARMTIGNVFKTKEAADRFIDYLKAITTIHQDKGVLTPEQVYIEAKDNGEAYHVGYIGKQNGEKVLCVCRDDLYYWPPVGGTLFDTEKHAQASLDKHPNEWKTITNYDWSKK